MRTSNQNTITAEVTFKLVTLEISNSGLPNFAIYRDAHGNSVFFDKNISELPAFITLSIDQDLYYNYHGKPKENFIFNINKPDISKSIKRDMSAENKLNSIYREVDRYGENEVPKSLLIIFQKQENSKETENKNFVFYVNAIGEKIRVPKSNSLDEFIEVPFNPRMYTAFSRTYQNYTANKNEVFIIPNYFYAEAGIESLNESRVKRESVTEILKIINSEYYRNPRIINLGFKDIPRPEIMDILISSQNKVPSTPIENKIETELRNTIAMLQSELAARDREINRIQEVLSRVMEERDGIRRNLEETMKRSQLDVLNENLTRTLQERDLLIKTLQQENQNLRDYLGQR